MASPIVRIDAEALKGFRRRAISAAKRKQEHIEAIFVEKIDGIFYVREVRKLKIVKATMWAVYTDEEEAKALAIEAREKGYQYATIHTHLQFTAPSAPSTTDILECSHLKEPLIGILDIIKERIDGRYKSTLTFWLPIRPCLTEIM